MVEVTQIVKWLHHSARPNQTFFASSSCIRSTSFLSIVTLINTIALMDDMKEGYNYDEGRRKKSFNKFIATNID